MNTRLQQFLGAENLSQSQFADEIGVARASVSHILAGRNKPGYEFLTGIMMRYPNLNMEWLLLGKGRMYKDTKPALQDPVAPQAVVPAVAPAAEGPLAVHGDGGAACMTDEWRGPARPPAPRARCPGRPGAPTTRGAGGSPGRSGATPSRAATGPGPRSGGSRRCRAAASGGAAARS